MANVKELKRVRAHIRRYPEKLDMDEWVCGTTACIAGRVALLNGWKPVISGIDPLGRQVASSCTKNGVTMEMDDVAAEILGIRGFDTNLFYTSNERVDRWLTALIDGTEIPNS